MAIAEKSILDPEASKPGVPLKKSTLAVFVLLLLALGFLSSLFLGGGKVRGQTAGPVVKDATALKKTGSDQTLKDEEAEAAKKTGQQRVASRSQAAEPASPATQRGAGPSAPLPAGAPAASVPASVRRENNSSALFDHKPQAGARFKAPAGKNEDLELEAQTRNAKALVIDSDPPHADVPSLLGTRRPQDGSLLTLGNSAPPPAPQAPSAEVAGQIDTIRKQLLAQAAGQAGPSRSEDGWVREYAKEATTGRATVNRGYQAPTRLVLRQGKIIPAVLGRQINSDLPGRITAYVSSNVYDDAGRLLIPMGSSLIGKYDSGVKVGQSRVMFAFERLVLPNGYSFNFPAAPGADLGGAAGMGGDVDNHFFKMFGTSLLIALVADHTKQPQSVTAFAPAGPLTAAGQVLSDVSKTVLERNRVIAPTITVDQGTRINVEVVADMVFPEQYPVR